MNVFVPSIFADTGFELIVVLSAHHADSANTVDNELVGWTSELANLTGWILGESVIAHTSSSFWVFIDSTIVAVSIEINKLIGFAFRNANSPLVNFSVLAVTTWSLPDFSNWTLHTISRNKIGIDSCAVDTFIWLRKSESCLAYAGGSL